jgi:hypothetical protein
MRYPPDPSDTPKPKQGSLVSALFGVAALALAGLNLRDFLATSKVAHLILLAAWLCWAFVWLAGAGLFRRKAPEPRPGDTPQPATLVSQRTLTVVSVIALVLLVCGWFLR